MIDFIDKTTEQSGTPLNRKNMMAIQNFEEKTTEFSENNIIETNSDGHTLNTTFNDDGTITQDFQGTKNISKLITFNEDGSITERIL